LFYLRLKKEKKVSRKRNFPTPGQVTKLLNDQKGAFSRRRKKKKIFKKIKVVLFGKKQKKKGKKKKKVRLQSSKV